MRLLRSKWFLGFSALLATCVVYAYFIYGSYQPADSRFTGAYQLNDGRLAVITPLDAANAFRLRFQKGGTVWRLHVSEDNSFDVFTGFDASPSPYTTGQFSLTEEGWPEGFSLSNGVTAQRMPVIERFGDVQSGNVSLRAKLVLPTTEGPHPIVALIHGSESYSAVDFYYFPYYLAANGFAAVVYDKRGTGASSGQYTQDFFVLADDAAAAVTWATEHPEIDTQRVNLMGFSQGGWISPIAAQKIPNIRSVNIHYGAAVPVIREDRWGYVYELNKKGFGEEAIRQADELNAVLSKLVDEQAPEGWAEWDQKFEQYKDADWMKAIKGSDSVLGMVVEYNLPTWVWRGFVWFMGRPLVPRTWDPAPVLAELTMPQHWILAGEDSSCPTPESLVVLERLRKEGKPIDVKVFENTEHGISTFESDETGARTITGYAPNYVDESLAWLKSKNDLTDVAP